MLANAPVTRQKEDLDLRIETYERYADYIGTIFTHCRCALDVTTEEAVSVLVHTIESVDLFVDSGSTIGLRNGYREAVMDLLQNQSSGNLPTNVERQVTYFRAYMEARGCLSSLMPIIQSMFSQQEEIRSTPDVDTYINLSLKEGEELSELILSVVGDLANTTSKKVSRLIFPLANLMDHIFDAQRDYEQNEISVQPRRDFYRKALQVVVRDIAKLFAVYPSRLGGLQFFIKILRRAWETRRYAAPQ